MKKVLKDLRGKIEVFIKDERGEFGIRQIAITLGVIMVVGIVVGILKDTYLEEWIGEAWDYLFLQIKALTS